MNVLITGGYGFIGSAVAERFHKEGYKVYIIDNLSSGNQNNLSIPHKSYRLNVEDRGCEEIFRSVGFDVVVHLAAQTDVSTSMERPVSDTQTNILGLVNMLNCSRQHGVKKFIFASSAAVYGHCDELPLKEGTVCAPISPYGMNKLLGEMYCEKWRDMYDLPTLCLRFANVYGPRQSSKGEGGVISIFLRRLLEGQHLTVYGDGNQTRDFIFVDDIADAVYRGATSDASGVYNVSTGKETSVKELIEVMGSFAKIRHVQYLGERPGDIARSSMDNTRIKHDLDWVPLYSLQEGLHRTFEWASQQEVAAAEEVVPKRKKPQWWKSVRPFLENAGAFAIVLFLSWDQGGFLYQDNFDFRLIYILLMGLVYGARQSTLSALLVIALYVGDSFANGRDWASLLYDPESLFISAIYLFFGLAVGFVTDKNRKELQFAHNELAIEQQRYKLLLEVHRDTRNVKDSLQRQVLTNRDSLGRLHTILTELESQEPEQVVSGAVKVLEELMETNRICIYSVSGSDYLRLRLKSNDTEWHVSRSLHVKEAPELEKIIKKQRIWVNKKLVPDLPLLAGPVVHEGRTVALVCVYEQNFENFTLYHENLFKVAVDLISRSLSRSFTFIDVTRNDRYVEETQILREAAFQEILRSKQAAKERYQADFTLLTVQLPDERMAQIAERLYVQLRETDYIGLWKGQLVLLLSNSGVEEAQAAMKRLERQGIHTGQVSEEALYA
ncbi:NAD-dependent epimerase/dehydratase family protein [Brevibacillus migulae]|uniref:NAD-dependent epimerase/dehydratase family protein n=1 Tax=Brevibacillus migulae TaxID=1644114 RepID=UPI00106DE390|nr:NAD-dependent epimerase/dehydratase family protein [Brevibacillus migulae]